MAKQILVPLKRDDGVKEIIPYVERVAQPGMKVVFLLRYPVYGFVWGRKESGIEATLEARKTAVRKIGEYYTWEEQRRLAENRVSPAREALERRGVEVTVDVCTDRLGRAVKSYTQNGDVHLIVMQAGIGLRIMKFLQGTVALFGLFKRPSFTPVLVFHPGTPL